VAVVHTNQAYIKILKYNKNSNIYRNSIKKIMQKNIINKNKTNESNNNIIIVR